MKKVFFILSMLLFVATFTPTVIAQPSTKETVEAAKARVKELKDELKAEQTTKEEVKAKIEAQQAIYNAQNARSQKIIWLIVAGGILIALFVFYQKQKSTVLSIIRIFTGSYRVKGDIHSLESKKILTGAIYADQQGAYLNTLKADIGSKRNTILSEWWGIDGRDSAVETLDYLKSKGFAYYFPTVYKAFKAGSDAERKDIITSTVTTQEDAEKAYSQTQNLLSSIEVMKKCHLIQQPEDVEKYGVLGWDAGRLIFIARLCYEAKYISEQEAWAYIDGAYEQAQKAFASWDELAKSYVIGRFLWKGSDANDGVEVIAEDLVKKSKSPWTQVAWK